MVNAYNPSTQEAHEVEASLDPISKKKKRHNIKCYQAYGLIGTLLDTKGNVNSNNLGNFFHFLLTLNMCIQQRNSTYFYTQPTCTCEYACIRMFMMILL
jgi:hypothetical protein